MNEGDYQRGQRQVWASILSTAAQHLGMTGRTVESLIIEREEVIASLRSICEDFGSNDWEPTNHLADVIRKNLENYLHAKQEKDAAHLNAVKILDAWAIKNDRQVPGIYYVGDTWHATGETFSEVPWRGSPVEARIAAAAAVAAADPSLLDGI